MEHIEIEHDPVAERRSPTSARGKLYRLIVTGRPCSKKNDRALWTYEKNGKTLPGSGRGGNVLAWERRALVQLSGQWQPRPPITTEAGVVVVFYRHPRQGLDVDNPVGSPLDALQAARVVKNDRLFSELVSVRLVDADRPRVEMFIYSRAEDLRALLAGAVWAPWPTAATQLEFGE